jgi:AhpD family alkylhydroperoxidase
MAEEKPITDRFTEALGREADLAFKSLASEILKDGALSAKEKALIALACSVAVRCEHCVKRHKETARKAGACKEEMLEAAAVAGLVRMGSGFNAAAALLDDSEK